MATAFGTTNGIFGIAAQQTGFLLDGTTEEYSQESKTVKNITGDDTGESYYNEKIEGTLEGWFPSTDGYSGTLAAAIVPATTPANHLVGGITGGTYVVQGITRNSVSGDYRRISTRWKFSRTIAA